MREKTQHYATTPAMFEFGGGAAVGGGDLVNGVTLWNVMEQEGRKGKKRLLNGKKRRKGTVTVKYTDINIEVTQYIHAGLYV